MAVCAAYFAPPPPPLGFLAYHLRCLWQSQQTGRELNGRNASQETRHRSDLCSPKVALHCHALPGRLWRVISCRNLTKKWGWCAHFSWADKDSCCDLAWSHYQEKGHQHCFVIPIHFLLIRGGILGRHKGSALSKPRLAEGRRHGCDAKWQIGLHTSGAP